MRPQRVSDEEILAVARRIFLAHGVSASVDLIAAELGISQPALFKRFGTKKNLMIEALRPPKEIPWHGVVAAGPDDRPFPEQLREVAEMIAEFLRAIVPVLRLVHTSNISHNELMCDHPEPLPAMAIKVLSGWLERCYKKGLIRKTNFRLAAMTILGTLQLESFSSLFNEKSVDVSKGSNKYIDEVVTLLWQGLKNEE